MLDHLNATSIRYRVAVGPGAGARTVTLKNPALVRADSTPKPFTANRDGFSLNCAVACQAHQRDRLERLSTNTAGHVVYTLKNPVRDGTTHILFSPELLYRPARQRRKSKDPATAQATPAQQPADPPTDSADPPTALLIWAQRRVTDH